VLKLAHIPYILACHLQPDADPDPVPDPAYHFDADPDADTNLYLMRVRTQVTKMMRIHADPDADPDPQHCFKDRTLLESHKTVKRFFIIVLLVDERVRIRPGGPKLSSS
jgi:hypothetical protein